jgi:hypothetical protein
VRLINDQALRAAADRHLGPVYADLEDLRRRQAAGRPG